MLSKTGTLVAADKRRVFHYNIRSLNHVFIHGHFDGVHFSFELYRRGDDNWCYMDDADCSTFVHHVGVFNPIGSMNHEGSLVREARDLWIQKLNEAFDANPVNESGKGIFNKVVERVRQNASDTPERDVVIKQFYNAWRELTLDNTLVQAMTNK